MSAAPEAVLDEAVLDDVVTLSDAHDMPAKRLRIHADEEHAVDPITRALWDRAADQAHRTWVDSLALRACDKAARDTAATGEALLLWTDSAGELQARRISREESVLREWVPEHLRRRGER